MPEPVKVFPTKASALNIKHPHGPKMVLAGVLWPMDSFTGRRLRDRSVTRDKAKVYVPVEPAAALPSAPVISSATAPTPPSATAPVAASPAAGAAG